MIPSSFFFVCFEFYVKQGCPFVCLMGVFSRFGSGLFCFLRCLVCVFIPYTIGVYVFQGVKGVVKIVIQRVNY